MDNNKTDSTNSNGETFKMLYMLSQLETGLNVQQYKRKQAGVRYIIRTTQQAKLDGRQE